MTAQHESVEQSDNHRVVVYAPANERRRYIVTSSLIGWAYTQNGYESCVFAFIKLLESHKMWYN